jgi:peptidoglycan/LPS O-acetylase OafA/YrhL
LGYFGLLHWRWTIIAVVAICLIMEWVLTETSLFIDVPFHHQCIAVLLNAVPFFVGAALARSDLTSRLIWGGTAFLTLSTVLLIWTSEFKSLLIVALPLAIILIARFGKCDLTRFGDYSYGIYLFAFPVQQSVIHFIPNIQATQLSIVAGVVTFAFAYVSWHFVEKRALALKPRRKGHFGVQSREDHDLVLAPKKATLP